MATAEINWGLYSAKRYKASPIVTGILTPEGTSRLQEMIAQYKRTGPRELTDMPKLLPGETLSFLVAYNAWLGMWVREKCDTVQIRIGSDMDIFEPVLCCWEEGS